MSTPPPDLPQPPWSSLRQKPVRRAPITRDSITLAALRVVDQEGLDGLSMRRLAEELHCQASALYVHVSGKPELLQLLIDHVAGELHIPAPQADRWQEQTKEVARAMYASLGRHRDLARAGLGSIPTGHNVLLLVDGLLAILRAGGLPRQVAAYAVDVLPLYIMASAYEASVFAQHLANDPGYFAELHAYLNALPSARFPTLSDLIEEVTAPDEAPDARFEFGLDVIVRGLAAAGEIPRAR